MPCCAIALDGTAYSIPWRLIGERVRVTVGASPMTATWRGCLRLIKVTIFGTVTSVSLAFLRRGGRFGRCACVMVVMALWIYTACSRRQVPSRGGWSPAPIVVTLAEAG